VKEAMFEWWGPILHEYYGGTEGNGVTYASPADWLAHPGTVGRAIMGEVRICDDSGEVLPCREIGTVYFELPGMPSEYHNEPALTKSVRNPRHPQWSTLGDVGWVDEEGFLYLADRATFMIVSGGVNIYPQEVEDCLVMHPMVEDVAVFGVPNDDMGEEVKAVVQVRPGIRADAGVERELLAFAREHLAHFKCPKSVDFEAELPRMPTGKLDKLPLRERYWTGRASRVV
jgi:acyl-CoA synthetase (AMP-forming)/AMP-acid ligase II